MSEHIQGGLAGTFKDTLTAQVLLDGKFETSYTEADNSVVVPTDTVKNTLYVLAQKAENVQTIERFGYEIGQHFINRYSDRAESIRRDQ
ncbi:tetrahydrobiopterin biosynthesis enzymes-like protein [Basidiobolus meristosporus CBS 931.73]|uniref:factor independent urate hydroxylase n=1 Tax=Basidiobolus meristosporus CBS 931.73 TaxID=1314790 RepID=A0A1Y1VPU2_9FUNG|nr:tetrahydrobiopterin biosynthesis enzymes-like protein [Basidiobolus meristosporus CBS 931.73]|eukprot:ORX63289.1 tetrahydrobiopterin biosynthesis enzymes-like protein [Basidiobolus meristosporus CBS 931.73]